MDSERQVRFSIILSVALSFYPCGSFLSFLLHSYTTIDKTLRDYSFIWALGFAAIGAFVAALILTISRAVAKRIVWLHYYLLAIGGTLMLLSGIVLVTGDFNDYGEYLSTHVIRPLSPNVCIDTVALFVDYTSSTVLGGLGYGLIYVSGMAFIHVRTNSYKHRVARLGLCHLAIAIGMVSSVSYMSKYFGYTKYYRVFGWFLVYSCSSVLACFLLNELLHALGALNYKRSLDPQIVQADEKKDRWHSALSLAQMKGNAEKQFFLTIMTLASKFLNGFQNNNVFLFISLTMQSYYVGAKRIQWAVPHYFLLGGVILGMIISLNVKLKRHYSTMTLLKTACLLAATILAVGQRQTHISGVLYWLFFLFGSATIFLPDAALMEVSNVKIFEFNLALGFFLEQIPIVVSIYFIREEFWHVVFDMEILWVNVGLCVGISVVLASWFSLYYPNTFHLKVLQVQRLVRFNRPEFGSPNEIPVVMAVNQQQFQGHAGNRPTTFVSLPPQGFMAQQHQPHHQPQHYPSPYGNNLYPNIQYPNVQYPNVQYPNVQYPNAPPPPVVHPGYESFDRAPEAIPTKSGPSANSNRSNYETVEAQQPPPSYQTVVGHRY